MKEIREKSMKEKLEQTIPCARAQDLVTYLYDEASELEAAEFKRHLEQCASCGSELAAFRSVRAEVVEWRNQSLPSFDALNTRAALENAVAPRRRSALAALREFFTLAPAWMRAATAFAAVLVCALVVFTAKYLYEPRQTIVQVTPTQAQVDEMVKQQVAEELRRREQEAKVKEVAPDKPSVAVAANNGSATAVLPKVKRPSQQPAVTLAQQRQRGVTDKAQESRQEARQQLAELVQTSKEDDGLPRLSDLIDDANDAQ
jgi:anti-sigma factor RsiW